MNAKQKVEFIAQNNPEAVLLDGFDDCIVGFVSNVRVWVVCYDYKKIIKKLQKRDGMTELEAVEFYEHNIFCCYCGDYSPLFLDVL